MADMVSCARCRARVAAGEADFAADGNGMWCKKCAVMAVDHRPPPNVRVVTRAEWLTINHARAMKVVIAGVMFVVVGGGYAIAAKSGLAGAHDRDGARYIALCFAAAGVAAIVAGLLKRREVVLERRKDQAAALRRAPEQ